MENLINPTPEIKDEPWPWRLHLLILFNIGIAFLCGWLLFKCLNETPFMTTEQVKALTESDNKIKGLSPLEQGMLDALLNDSNNIKTLAEVKASVKPKIECPPCPKPAPLSELLEIVLKMMLLTGALGGCLANFRGFFVKISREKRFAETDELPYYVRPFMGALCGLLIFFVGSFFNASFASGSVPAWATMHGCFPYLGFAILAGFSSQEFLVRLKEVAKTLFAFNDPQKMVGMEEELAKLKRWRDAGLINEEQYKDMVKKVLAAYPAAVELGADSSIPEVERPTEGAGNPPLGNSANTEHTESENPLDASDAVGDDSKDDRNG